MKLTAFYNLKKPEGRDVVNVDDFNDNFDVIDTALNEAANASGDLSNGKVFTSMASSRVAPASGDTLATIVSKVMKWLNDLGAAAWQGVANNSTTTASGYVADARALKVVSDRVTALETSFPDGCSIIANAITGGRDGNGTGGETTAATASPSTMATNIKKVAQKNYNAAKVGTAVAADVISGKTFTNSSTVGATGSLADYRNNIQSVTATATGGTKSGTVLDGSGTWYEDLTIPNGAHNKVRVNKHLIYRQGAADADARVNTSSASYTQGKTDSAALMPSTLNLNFYSGNAATPTEALHTTAKFYIPPGYTKIKKVSGSNAGNLTVAYGSSSLNLTASYQTCSDNVIAELTYGGAPSQTSVSVSITLSK